MGASPAAAGETTVLICTEDGTGDRELAELLIKDIRQLGYTAYSRTDCGAFSNADAAALLADENAQGMVTLDLTTGLATVHVRTEQPGAAAKRSLPISTGGDGNRSQISLRISELLRATFIEVETTGEPPKPTHPDGTAKRSGGTDAGTPQAPKATSKPTVEEDEPSSSQSAPQPPTAPPEPSEKDAPAGSYGSVQAVLLEVRGAVTARSFEPPPTAQLLLGAHIPFRTVAGLELFAFVPLSPLKIREPEGEISIRHGTVATGVRLTWGNDTQRIRGAFGIGIGLDMTFVHTEADPEMKSQSKTVFGALFYGRIQLQTVLSRRIALVGESLLGTVIPRSRVTVMGEEAVTLSAVVLSGLMGINVIF
ncbi:MAG: hypothetical protein GY847_30355 [Proteobacteria bacterium]|nr:hypothetical protein [Pseudomonadota bacterium]